MRFTKLKMELAMLVNDCVQEKMQKLVWWWGFV
jgi:hypothetical protein